MSRPLMQGARAIEWGALIPLPPCDYDLTAQAMFLAQHLRSHGYEALAALLAKQEKAARDAAKGTRKKKVQLKGVKGKSGTFFVAYNDMDAS